MSSSMDRVPTEQLGSLSEYFDRLRENVVSARKGGVTAAEFLHHELQRGRPKNGIAFLPTGKECQMICHDDESYEKSRELWFEAYDQPGDPLCQVMHTNRKDTFYDE